MSNFSASVQLDVEDNISSHVKYVGLQRAQRSAKIPR